MPRPIRAILCAILGAALASLVFVTPDHSVVPLWGWGIWIVGATVAGYCIGLRGPTIGRNKFSVMLILLGSFYMFMLGAIGGQIPNVTTLRTNLVAGAIFLAGFTLLIRLMIRLMRWADGKWG